MDTKKHTPGPWTVRTGSLMNAFWLLDAEKNMIGTFNQSGNDAAQGASNARLIAAGPAMLKALLFCRSVIIKMGPVDRSELLAIEAADAAIAEAGGELTERQPADPIAINSEMLHALLTIKSDSQDLLPHIHAIASAAIASATEE